LKERSLKEFYVNAHQVLLTLENKANKRYYDSLEKESHHRMKQFNKQNEVLHDYVCQLDAYGHLEDQLRLLHSHGKNAG